jgi:hypothetical protein
MEDCYFWHEDDFDRLLSTDTTTFDGGSVHHGCRGVMYVAHNSTQ